MPVHVEFPPLEKGARFELGRLLATPGVLNSVPSDDMWLSLRRHHRGDWGDLDEHDKKVNEEALLLGNRLFSAYRSVSGARFWIITEADRSVTTFLLPSEY